MKQTFLGCRKWGCNKWGFKGCLAALPGNQPKSAFFALFLPFSPFLEGPNSTWEIQKTEEKGLFPQISSDLLKPPSLKPPFAALQLFTLPALRKICVSFFFEFAWEFCIENGGDFWLIFLVSVSNETTHENSSKRNRGKFGAKFGAKFGTKIRKIRGTFVLRLFCPKNLWKAHKFQERFGALFVRELVAQNKRTSCQLRSAKARLWIWEFFITKSIATASISLPQKHHNRFPRKITGYTSQCAGKGGRQKGISHFYSASVTFLVSVLSLSVVVLVTFCLSPFASPFCGRVN